MLSFLVCLFVFLVKQLLSYIYLIFYLFLFHLFFSPNFRYGTTPRSQRPAPRVKPEASDNASRDTNAEMRNVLDYSKPQRTAPPPPSRPSMLSRLMHDGDKMHPDPPLNFRGSADARKIRNKQKSQVSKVFAETSKWQMVPTAGTRGGSAY